MANDINIPTGLTVQNSDLVDDRMSFPDLAARDALLTVRRREGLFCYVESEQKNYQLRGGISNANWVENGASVGNVSLGINGQIPFMNAANTNFEYNSGVLFYDRVAGNIGMGTATPNYKLDVQGNIGMSGDTLYYRTDSGGSQSLKIGSSTTPNNTNINRYIEITTNSGGPSITGVGNVSSNLNLSSGGTGNGKVTFTLSEAEEAFVFNRNNIERAKFANVAGSDHFTFGASNSRFGFGGPISSSFEAAFAGSVFINGGIKTGGATTSSVHRNLFTGNTVFKTNAGGGLTIDTNNEALEEGLAIRVFSRNMELGSYDNANFFVSTAYEHTNNTSINDLIKWRTAATDRMWLNHRGHLNLGENLDVNYLAHFYGPMLIRVRDTADWSTGSIIFRASADNNNYCDFVVDVEPAGVGETTVTFGLLGRLNYNGNGGRMTISNLSTQVGTSWTRFVQGVTEVYRITDTARIGINTTNPQQRLDVVDNIRATDGYFESFGVDNGIRRGAILRNNRVSGTNVGVSLDFLVSATGTVTNSIRAVGTDVSGRLALAFHVSDGNNFNYEAARFSENGNLLIGSTDNTAKMFVSNDNNRICTVFRRAPGQTADMIQIRKDNNSVDSAFNVKGWLAVGRTTALETVHLGGAIVVAEHENPTPIAGTIEWDGTNFRGYNGTTWVILG